MCFYFLYWIKKYDPGGLMSPQETPKNGKWQLPGGFLRNPQILCHPLHVWFTLPSPRWIHLGWVFPLKSG